MYVSRARTALCPYSEREREREREKEREGGEEREPTGIRSIYSSGRSYVVRHAYAGGPAGEGARGGTVGHRPVSLSLVEDHTCGVCIHRAGTG